MRRKGLGLPVKFRGAPGAIQGNTVTIQGSRLSTWHKEKVPHHCRTFCLWSDYDLLVVSFRS